MDFVVCVCHWHVVRIAQHTLTSNNTTNQAMAGYKEHDRVAKKRLLLVKTTALQQHTRTYTQIRHCSELYNREQDLQHQMCTPCHTICTCIQFYSHNTNSFACKFKIKLSKCLYTTNELNDKLFLGFIC